MRHIRGMKYYALKLLNQYSAKRNNMLNLAYFLKSDTHFIIFVYIKLGDVVTIETTFLLFYVLFFCFTFHARYTKRPVPSRCNCLKLRNKLEDV